MYTNGSTPRNNSYINFAAGDETQTAIYGPSLERLKTLKQKYDPKRVFDQWFPIQTDGYPSSKLKN